MPPFQAWRAREQGDGGGIYRAVCLFQHQHFPSSRGRRVSRGALIGKLIRRTTEKRVGPCPLESLFCCGVALCPGIAVLPNPSSCPAALAWRRSAILCCPLLRTSVCP